MSQNAPNPKPSSRLKKILQGLSDDLKRQVGRRPGSASASQSAGTGYLIQNRLLPAFWTVASGISMAVNVVLIAILLVLLQILGRTPFQPDDQYAGLLGGLYHNFVRMDQATIATTIPVTANIPINLNVPVRIPKTKVDVTLIAAATIPNAHVVINQPGVAIDAPANISLPVGTQLSVEIDSTNPKYPPYDPFNLPVQSEIPISLNIPVNIPLNQTKLHEPFVGLQEVVRPYYCLVEPNATVNGVQICSPLASPVIQPAPTLPLIP